jgi:hypothetical protein
VADVTFAEKFTLIASRFAQMESHRIKFTRSAEV